MAHNIWNDGKQNAMWCKGDRKAAWHELGQRTPDAQTWEQAMTLAGLDWRVIKRQLFGTMADDNSNLQPIPAWGIFRDSDGAYLGNRGGTT